MQRFAKRFYSFASLLDLPLQTPKLVVNLPKQGDLQTQFQKCLDRGQSTKAQKLYNELPSPTLDDLQSLIVCHLPRLKLFEMNWLFINQTNGKQQNHVMEMKNQVDEFKNRGGVFGKDFYGDFLQTAVFRALTMKDSQEFTWLVAGMRDQALCPPLSNLIGLTRNFLICI